MTLNPGEVIVNRYKIVKKLGEGGFGAVYLAEDMHLRNKKVAIKQNTVTATDPALVRSVREQFEHEAATLANLSHPNLPRVTDFFVNPQGQFLIMDFISGTDLQDICNQKGQLSEAEIFPIILQILDSLIYIHSLKPPVIHRDIKPANIRVREDGVAFLVDFGISKTTATLDGARAFSPHFSPPEQYGAGTDARSDIYALGATLYALLTGKVPTDSLARYSGAPFIAPRQINPSISTEIEKIILKAMEFQMSDRFQSTSELRDVLSLLQKTPLENTPPIKYVKLNGFHTIDRKEVTVSQDGTKDYRTIMEGISAAGYVGRVSVYPGKYEEEICITNRGIEIVGIGDCQKIEIRTPHDVPAICLSTGSLLIRNISISNLNRLFQHEVLVLKNGKITLDECHFSASSFDGKIGHMITITDCTFVISRCEVVFSRRAMIINGTSKGVIESCRLYQCETGIVISDKAEPVIKNCKVVNCLQDGVICGHESFPVFQNCEISSNGHHGVLIVGQSQPEFQSCLFSSNKLCGIYCSDQAKPKFEDCQFKDHEDYPVIRLTDSSSATFKKCFIHNNKYGIQCSKESYPVFNGCEIIDNIEVGVDITNQSKPAFRNCKIQNNKSWGVVCRDESEPVFEDCIMTGNSKGNYWKEETSHPTLVRCQY